jgi:FkbM family methyltransferase
VSSFRANIESIAVKYFPDRLFALLVPFWIKDTKITHKPEGWLIQRAGLQMMSSTPKYLFMRMNEFEAKFEKHFKINEGETAVDVGACYGDTTIPMLIKTGKSGKVIAVEANPVNAKYLRMNVSEYQNCEVIEKAVWNKKGQISFWLHQAPTGGSIEHAYERNKEIKVDADTLDSLINGRHVDFLKIDVQGIEGEIISGAMNTLKSANKFVIETHYRDAPQKTYPKVLEEIKELKHKIFFDPKDGMIYGIMQ